MELKEGTHLQNEKYQIVRKLGQGGFGITYVATTKGVADGSIGKIAVDIKVAIKEFYMKDACERGEDETTVTVPTTANKAMVEQCRKKFIKEANNLASLDHPNIVKVFDVFEENDTVYYVMQYLDGCSLSEYVRNQSNGKLSEGGAIKIIRQIGSALNYMHTEKHLCHYDVKPGNIMLDNEGKAYLIDFGISKNYDSNGHQVTSTTPVGISRGYAPLEQQEQKLSELSPQTDVYALGATLYHCVTGNEPPEISTILRGGFPEKPSDVSATVWNAIRRAMAVSRENRPQSVKDFLDLLDGKTVLSDTEAKGEETIMGNGETANMKHGQNDDETTRMETESDQAGSDEEETSQTPMNLYDYFRKCLSLYFTFSGRACRREFWGYMLFSLLSGLTLAVLVLLISVPFNAPIDRVCNTLFDVIFYALLLPSIAVSIRRLHDIGKSGYWWLFTLVPILGWGILIYFYCIEGEQGENDYGDDPKEESDDPSDYVDTIMVVIVGAVLAIGIVAWANMGQSQTARNNAAVTNSTSLDSSNNVISASDLSDGEYTDGRIAFTAPENCKVEELPDSASGGKIFRLSTSAMVIIVYSCRSASLTESDFETAFKSWQDPSLSGLEETVLSTNKTEDNGKIIFNREAKYSNVNNEYMRYFTIVFDSETKKAVIVQTFGQAKTAHDGVVNSIRFK
jgi:serine/threonine protein kinase